MTRRRFRFRDDSVDITQAERLFAHFVRSVTRSRKAPSSADGDVTAVVSPPTKSKRRIDDDTAPIQQMMMEASIEDVPRRLLGLANSAGCMSDAERQRLLVEIAALYRCGHQSDVVAEVERVRSGYPDDLELHGALAEFFFERGDIDRAMDLMFAMVDIFFERRDLNAARRCIERIRTLDPENKRICKFENLL